MLSVLPLPYQANGLKVLNLIKSDAYPILLDSAADLIALEDSTPSNSDLDNSRYDVISAAPYMCFIAENDSYKLLDANNRCIESGNNGAIPKLRALYERERQRFSRHALNDDGSYAQNTETPFIGGALGYFGYHANFESFGLQKLNTDRQELPDICIGFYDWAVINDHKNKTSKYICLDDSLEANSQGPDHKTGESKPRHLSRYEYLNELLSYAKSSPSATQLKVHDFKSNFGRERYGEAFAKIKDYIEAGDCYQVNLAQRFECEIAIDSWICYQTLRESSPAPYSSFFSTPFGDILCFSPESFLNSNQAGMVKSSPIKGTRKREADTDKDNLAIQALANSEKDKAENLMIVDLIRNDLSKNCELNSVNVEQLFDIKSFSNVHHMVSTVSGQKGADKSNLDLLLDCFPGGSITGTPKKRAMEVIRQLEPHNRQVYCGSMGYLSYDGQMEFNIAIRTAVICNEHFYCWGGGGLVADSQPESEYQESLTKINNLLNCLKKPE